ncbi:MAG: QueT transporter family protein [Erysipelotrichaceae bacterium]|nr:QueT transporter family protein [Erysipelotrichaceae bacterium]
MNTMTVKKIAVFALVASVYTVLSLVVAPFSFGQIQVRLGEALMVLALINKDYVWALTLGCFLTNMIGVMTSVDPMPLDILVGTAATLAAGLLVYRFRKVLWKGLPIFPLLWVAIVNGVFVGLELGYYLGVNVPLTMIYVFIGEVISAGLGLFLYEPLKKALEKIYY